MLQFLILCYDVPDLPDISTGQDHPGGHRHVAPGHLGQGQMGHALLFNSSLQ